MSHDRFTELSLDMLGDAQGGLHMGGYGLAAFGPYGDPAYAAAFADPALAMAGYAALFPFGEAGAPGRPGNAPLDLASDLFSGAAGQPGQDGAPGASLFGGVGGQGGQGGASY